MAKSIIKEIIIMLLVCLAILLVLCILLYDFIPTNKVLPAEVSYQASEEIKQAVETAVNDEATKVVLSYEITSRDLKNYEYSKDYNAGKVNPFSAYIEKPDGEQGEDNTNTGTGSSSNSGSSNTGSNSGTYYPNGNAK